MRRSREMRVAHDFGNGCGWFVARRLVVLVCLLSGFVAAMPGAASATSSYTATDLGTLPGSIISSAYGINDRGQIVGWATTASGYPHAFSYTPKGGMVDLGTLPGDPNSVAYGVNDGGEIVGYSGTPSSAHAFSYTPKGGMVDLGTLPGGSNSTATGVNDHGQIVGWSTTASGDTHAF